MKKLQLLVFSIFFIVFCAPLKTIAGNSEDPITLQANALLNKMSLKEKIGQKMMLDIRYFCETPPQDGKPCTQDFTTMNREVRRLLSENHIGGIILFSNNMKNIEQITTLTDALQNAMVQAGKLQLLISTDQEGGIVARLPRDVTVSFPGNMALAAAYLGQANRSYSEEVGRTFAMNLKAVGIHIDFAPAVDVNVNPLNPVIHVRSFSDDPKIVAKLGAKFTQAMQKEKIAATLKHFPGHGDTVTDSHVSLPLVNHSVDEAWAIDLYPFQKIIETASPDLIMTAHIQYPALDNSQIYAGKSGKVITVPATLSRKILVDLLRHQLKFQGVIITDALDMGAIAQNFDSLDATLKAFQAGDDIALMPLVISKPQDFDQVKIMISKIEANVLNGTLSESELNQSVLRILKLKIKLGLLTVDPRPLSEKIKQAKALFADPAQHELERNLANDSVTLVQNNHQLIPIQLTENAKIHILTPWLEQGYGIAQEIDSLKAKNLIPKTVKVSFVKMADTDFDSEKKAIDDADLIIVGFAETQLKPQSFLSVGLSASSALLMGDSEQYSDRKLFNGLFSKMSLAEDLFAYQALQYASSQHKKTIFISLLAPYDLPHYAKVSDAMLAGYDHYGYLSTDQNKGYYRGPSMQALTRIIFGVKSAKGKLPVNIPDPQNPEMIVYPRGYGL